MADGPSLEQAELLLALGRPEEALGDLLGLVESAPGDPRALGLLARAQLDTEDPGAAAVTAVRGVAAAPQDLGLRWSLAQAAWATGALREAEAATASLLARDPEHARALALWGWLQARHGEHDEAREALAAAAERDPEDPWIAARPAEAAAEAP